MYGYFIQKKIWNDKINSYENILVYERYVLVEK